jgi:hypothetical protein
VHTNLLNCITHKAGFWFQSTEHCGPGLIKLSRPEDEVTLTGPLSVNVTVLAENVTQPAAGGSPQAQTQEISSYDLDIPAGHTWAYRMADLPALIGSNRGRSVVIRPTLPRRPPLVQAAPDLPCDFASVSIPHTGQFFPSGCEGCPPGSVIGTPPVCGPVLDIPTTRGGCVRPRFFNGMFLTREDLETQLRYVRLKNRLQNRAAGQGVVWGLAVRRHGNKVRVETGYAVDCCGNDLTVTCDYDVDIATLLRDPASCHLLTEGPRRLHLLLEYVECPEEPRPVHGDPCSPQTSLCEMSRVRETVRLRLVPPRDYKPDGPIGRFLDRLKRHLESLPVESAMDRTSRANPAGPIEPLVPFTIEVAIAGAASPLEKLQPSVEGGSPVIRDVGTSTSDVNVKVTVIPHSDFEFTAGTPVIEPDGATNLAVLTDTPREKVWEFQIGRDRPFSLWFLQWTARRTDGAVISGSTEMQMEMRLVPTPGGTALLPQFHVEIPPAKVEIAAGVEPVAWPCLSEACDPHGMLRFPVLPPWSHQDPLGTLIPADPKVLALAVLYSLLALTAGRFQDDEAASTSSMVQQFARIYRAAWLVLFRVAPDTEQRRLSVLLKELLAEWCNGLLYPGPQCQGEPHGVVIGCALVKAGDICEVDSWGGRRWVVHYPLLAYWGEQFGLTPPDVLASRLFDFICCIADLRLPPLPPRDRDQPTGSTTHVSTAVFPVGRSYLMFGDREDVLVRAKELKMQHGPVKEVGLLDFIQRVVAGARSPGDPKGPYTLYAPAGFANVYFAVPERPEPGVLVRPDRGRIIRLIRPSLVAPTGVAVPPLVRSFAEDLTVELLDEMPVTRMVGDQSPLLDPLRQAGITTVGAVLARDPEALHEEVLNRAHTPELTKLLDGSEKAATAFARSVGETVQKHAAQKLVTREDYRNDQAVAAFNKELATRLRAEVSPEVVPSAVKRAANRSPEREE